MERVIYMQRVPRRANDANLESSFLFYSMLNDTVDLPQGARLGFPCWRKWGVGGAVCCPAGSYCRTAYIGHPNRNQYSSSAPYRTYRT